MAIIYSYPTVTPASGDLIVGTDITGKVTKNFTVGSIVSTEIPTYITGTTNSVPLFTGANTIGNSIINQNAGGDKVFIGGELDVSGGDGISLDENAFLSIENDKFLVGDWDNNALSLGLYDETSTEILTIENGGAQVNGSFTVDNAGDTVLSVNPASGVFSIGDTEGLGDGVYITNSNTSFLDIYGNDALKFRMNADGDVGIGTSTPTRKLDVVDTRTSLSGVTSTSPADAVFNTINLAHTADAPQARSRATVSELVNSSSFSSLVNTASRSTAKATGSGDIAALYGASNWSIVEGTGNYTYSTGGLNWSRIDNPSATVANVSGTHAEVQLAQGTVGNINVCDFDFDQEAGTTITGDFNYINVKNESPINISGTARALNIESTLPSYLAGDVGIGTSTPSSKLDVNGTVSISNTGTSGTLNLKSSSTAPGGNYIHAKKSDNSNQWVLGSNLASTDQVVLKQYNDADIIFQNNNGDAVTINSNRNVGIGTTNPISQLQVAGSITTNGLSVISPGTNNTSLSITSYSDTSYINGGTSGDDIVFGAPVSSYVTNVDVKGKVTAEELESTVANKGLILKSPDGTRYRVTVANGGTLSVSAV